jgi:tetratricopeptide (TPR) repeat protein
MPRSNRDPYVVRSVVHASEVLGAFHDPGETLRLRDVVERTGFRKGLCFRLLHTLHHCGLLEKVDASHHRLTSNGRRNRRFRIGYAAQGQDSSFSAEVLTSLQRAAGRKGMELIGLGRVLIAQGHPDLALPHLEKAAALDPGDDVAFFHLWQAYRAVGRADDEKKALAEFQRLRTKRPEEERMGLLRQQVLPEQELQDQMKKP